MFIGLKVNTKHGNSRVARAIKKDREDQFQYLLEFYVNKSNFSYGGKDMKAQVIMSPAAGINDPNLISFEFSLTRGLYDVYITRVAEIQGRDIRTEEGTRCKYPDPVMVGEKYAIKAKIEDSTCYGVSGVRIRISSSELPLDSESAYYTITKENLSHIKYYIPFNNSKIIDFFVQDVKKEEIKLFLDNPSFQIELL